MKTLCLATISLFGLTTIAFAQATEEAPRLAPLPTDQPSPRAATGLALQRDSSPLPEGGKLQMSYADVVERILPSVVTIFPSSAVKMGGGGRNFSEEELDAIPPQMRPFFYRYFGLPEDGEPEDEPVNPRRRGPNPGREAPQQPEMPRQRGVGSGVIVSADGYILTNNHVVEGADDIEVAVERDGVKKTYKAKVIGTDPLTDVGVIKIEAEGLIPATIGDSTKLRVGDIVLAAGAPMQLNLSVTQGIVSALGRSGMGVVSSGRMAGYEDFIQTDAAINPGNSGGPLVDSLGRVIGINTAILSRTGMNGGIGFAIPINMALDIVGDLMSSGAVRRGYLGVQIQDLDLEKSELLGLMDQGGALVTMVGGDSPAALAGIEPGDVIVGVNGDKVENSSRLRLVISSKKPGTEIPLKVVRNGKVMEVKAKLEELPSEAIAEASPGVVPRGKGAAPSKELVSGLVVRELNAALRTEFKLPETVAGLVVTEVDPGSRAAAMGIQKGDVIQEINRTVVGNLTEAQKLVKETEKTALLRIWREGDSMLVMIGV